MFGSETLDVAIGLVFLFLLLSLVCSSIKEALETVLRFRARDLQRGIREMFGEIGSAGMVAEFYQHPLINGLFRGAYNPKNLRNLPAYIPPRTFALAVMDLLRPAHKQQPLVMPAAETLSGDPAAVAAQARVASMHAFVEFRNAAATLENESLKRALLPLIDASGNDLTRARENIEDWYNSSMDRVSGWYKRRTQQIIAAIGLALAAFMNIDAVGIARYLNTSQTARAAIVARLQSGRDIKGPNNSDLVDPMGWLQRQGGLPVGWVFVPEPKQTGADFENDWRRAPDDLGGWVVKVAGILFTTFAITLGAPFWFDILNKFMVVRSTVKPQEKSREEKSKD